MAMLQFSPEEIAMELQALKSPCQQCEEWQAMNPTVSLVKNHIA